MHTCPVFDLFSQVGEVTLRQEGLYFRLLSTIYTAREGFIHLFAHGENYTEQLGLYLPQADEHFLQSRISARRLGEVSALRFSINSVPYHCLTQPLADGFFPKSALLLQEEKTRCVIIPAQAPFEEEIMPFFCFLQPKKIEGLPCLTLEVNEHGRPIVPEINL